MSTTEEVRSALRAKSVEKDTFDTNPVKQFVSWFRDACSARATMPDAMTLSTVAYCPKTKLMKPSSRAVLVKDIVLDNKLIPAYMYLRPEAKVDMMDATTYLAQQQGSGAQVEDGFIFCTNYNSRKGVEIEENPWVSLYFLWHELERAVRIEGPIRKVPAALSDRYHNERPRASRVSAAASDQSKPLASYTDLVSRTEALDKSFASAAPAEDPAFVPRPEHWGGYYIVPHRMEFWQGRPSRRHERLEYTLEEDAGVAAAEGGSTSSSASTNGSLDIAKPKQMKWTKVYLQP